MVVLDKEKKIKELEEKIQSLEAFSKEENINLESEINRLRERLTAIKEETFRELTPWDRVTLARFRGRPTALDLIPIIFDNFIELHGDRYFGDDPAVIGGIALLDGKPVTVIAQQKGRDTEESIKRNFGMAGPEGYRKSLRLMKQAEKFNRPVICLVDTPGAFCGIEAEERGEGEAIARNLMEISRLKTPVISVVLGEGGSGGALALAVGDKVYMLENSIYSILSPEGFASILWKDAAKAKEAAEIMKITAYDLLKFGFIEEVIKEPLGGAQNSLEDTAKAIKGVLVRDIAALTEKDKESLINERYDRFRKFGEYGPKES